MSSTRFDTTGGLPPGVIEGILGPILVGSTLKGGLKFNLEGYISGCMADRGTFRRVAVRRHVSTML